MNFLDKQKPKILIVDDKPENLVVLEQLLMHLDVQLIKAYSGNEAIAYTMEHDFMLILLDVQMPGMDGYEVLEILSWDEKTKHIPVIFVTANYADEQHKLKGYLTGAVDYLTKPINDHILVSKVKVFLELHQQRQQLSELQEYYQSIVESVGEGILVVDNRGEINFANPAVNTLLGWSIDTILGKNIDIILPKKNNPETLFNWKQTKLYQTCMAGDIYKQSDTHFIKADGNNISVQYTATPIHNSQKQLQSIVLVFVDITLHKNAQQQLKELAHHDHLTDLPNRLMFNKTMQQAIARCQRHQQNIGLLFCDFDNFKMINDNYGHNIGDAFLQNVARRLQGCIRESDTIARLGGDEFAIIIESIHSDADAVKVADKILAVLKAPLTLGGHEIQANISIGIATYPESGLTATMITKHADMAMYRAKNQGGQRYCLFTSDMDQEYLHQLNLEAELEQAIKLNHLVSVFEPRFNAATESVVCFDVSANWNHPKIGTMITDHFSPLIENNHHRLLFDRWLLTQACAAFQDWQQRSLAIQSVSVSVTSVDLLNQDHHAFIQELLTDYQLQANQLELKLSEALLAQLDSPTIVIQQLTDMGVAVMLDNFGTGPQSLALLRDAPVSRIALAKQFVQASAESEVDDAIIHSIIELAHQLKIKILAKCVENDAQWYFLKGQGCDEYFGNYFAKPLRADEIDAFMNREESLQSS